MTYNGSEHCHNIGDTLSEQANYHVNSSLRPRNDVEILMKSVTFLYNSLPPNFHRRKLQRELRQSSSPLRVEKNHRLWCQE